MNLKTHTAYPEITVDQNHIFTIKIVDANGSVQFEDIGAGKNNIDARSRAKAIVERESINYKKGV